MNICKKRRDKHIKYFSPMKNYTVTKINEYIKYIYESISKYIE